MSLKEAENFLNKHGKKRRISKFDAYKEEIKYMYNEGASLEIITQFLETKGVKRVKGYNALSSYIKRNLTDDILRPKNHIQKKATQVIKQETKPLEKNEQLQESDINSLFNRSNVKIKDGSIKPPPDWIKERREKEKRSLLEA